MPYTRKTNRRYSRKKPTTKRPSTKSTTTTKRTFRRAKPQKQPFSHHEYTNMKYQYNNDLQTNATVNLSGTEFPFFLNDINRPYFAQTAGDKLPSGHVQYTNVFNKFKVNAAKITFEMNPNMTGKQLTLLMQLNNSSNYYQAIQGVSAQSVSGYQNTWTYIIPSDKKFKFTKYVSIQKLEALTSLQFKADLDKYCGTPTSNNTLIASYGPKKPITFKFSLINETDATVVSVPFEIKIDYYCQWYDRQRLPQSQTY